MDEYCEDDRDVILDMGEAAQHKGSQRSTSGTTGSPKLPPLEKFLKYSDAYEVPRFAGRRLYAWIGRQLRASA